MKLKLGYEFRNYLAAYLSPKLGMIKFSLYNILNETVIIAYSYLQLIKCEIQGVLKIRAQRMTIGVSV